jgi:molybdate transport system substrate-binding protein
VFAAASLTDVLNDLAAAWQAAGHDRPAISYAASSALARQIEQGAPAGLFLSADEPWMEDVAERGLIVPDSRRALLGNELVLVAPATAPFTVAIKPGFPLAELLKGKRLSVADPDSVPAGKYAKASLTSLGVWDQVKDSLASSESVRAALLFVERGEVAAGIVYKTDALISRKVMIAGIFPENSHPPITYPMALLKAHATPDAIAFRDYLLSPTAKAVFVNYGFTVK